jgi:pimeloyl-ACP methyl ester carboxylesterase
MTHPLIELGGHGPLVHLAPANGFPPETYVPALGPVLAGHKVISLPPRAMWPDVGAPPEAPGSWVTLADDLLEGITVHQLPPLIGVGHSFGAVATLIAAAREPTRFRALVLLDPTIAPPDFMEQFREQRRRGENAFRPLVQGARKRRGRFATAAEAFDYWRGKPLFADWTDAALNHYVQAMLRPSELGDFVLAWSAAWEAHYYESFYTESWDDIRRLDPALPVLVVAGATSDTFFPEAAGLLQERLPHAELHTIPGYGHLFPQAAPELTGRILADWLNRLSAP